jgi:hypothetical protein
MKLKGLLTTLIAVVAFSGLVVPAEACFRRLFQPSYYSPPYYSNQPYIIVSPTTVPPVVNPVEKIPVVPAKGKLIHLRFALYELREAKLDVRAIKGDIPDKVRNSILGKLDAGADALKKLYEEATGDKAPYDAPTERPEYKDYQHIRHAIKELKLSKEQLKIEQGLSEPLRAEALGLIDEAIGQLETALDWAGKKK